MRIKMYLTAENLKAACVDNGWFDNGDNKAYEKLFDYHSKVFSNFNEYALEVLAILIGINTSDVDCDKGEHRAIIEELLNNYIQFVTVAD